MSFWIISIKNLAHLSVHQCMTEDIRQDQEDLIFGVVDGRSRNIGFDASDGLNFACDLSQLVRRSDRCK